MVRLYMLLTLVEIALTIAALISCLSAEEGEILALSRIAWVLIILFFPLVGSIAWFVAGRPEAAARPTGWRIGRGFPEAERPRPLAPDDDPEFLQRLAKESKQDRALLEQWEADLRRREEELRRRTEDDPPRHDRQPES